MNRANHVIELHEICAPKYAKYDGAPECSDKPFNSFLRREFDQGRAPKGDAPDVSKYIVANHQGSGNPEPNQTFQDVIDNEVAEERMSY